MPRLLRALVLAVVAPLLLVSPQAARHAEPQERAAREPLTVMSFNIRYGTAKDGENHRPFCSAGTAFT